MARLTLVLVSALVVAPGCKHEDQAAARDEEPAREAFPEPLRLIPDEADGVVGINTKVLAASAVVTKIAKLATAREPELEQLARALDGCGLEPTSFETALLAAHGKEFVVVLGGEGFGADARASCIIKGIQRLVGAEERADISVEDGKKIVDFPDGRVFLVNDDLLVLVTAAWQERVAGLIDGEGEPAIEHRKRTLIAEVDTAAAVWLVSDLPPELGMMANFIGVPELGEANTLTGVLDVKDGATVDLSAGFEHAKHARAAATQLDAFMSGIAADAPEDLAAALERVHVGAGGSSMRVTFSVVPSDLQTLYEQL